MKKNLRVLFLLVASCALLSCVKKNDSPAAHADNTADDSFDDSSHRYTYRTTGSAPSTWNPTDWQMASDRLPLDYTCDGLYEFNLNETRDGYVIEPGMASKMPEDVTASYAGRYGLPADAKSGYAWKIHLRDDLCWDNGEKIDVDDFIYSAQQFLNPKMKNYRASSLYADSLQLVGAEDYYEGKGSWDNVGLIKDDDLTFTLVLKNSLTPFMFLYNSSSFVLLREDLYEAGKKESGDLIKSSYGTSVESSASYGPYKISAYQPDKSMTLTRNEKWRGYHDGLHKGQYQTTGLYIQYIIEHQTILSLFLQGELDDTALVTKDLDKYGASEYHLINPLYYTWKFSFNIDRESLLKENVPGENHVVISNINFRHGVSLAIDRQKYCDTVTIGSTPGYGLLNYSFVADPEKNILYRDTPEAQATLMEFYGTDNYEDITGYDLVAARSYFRKAWNELAAAGDVKDSDKFFIDFHTYGSDEIYMQTVTFVQDAINEAAKGTPFDSKITVRQVTDQNYYDNMKTGNVDLAMTAWGGSSFDPYDVLWCYCTNEALNEYGFDPYKEMHTINIGGKNITKSLNGWYQALCVNEYTSAPFDTRNKILASCEGKLLSYYNMIPVRYHNSNVMISQRIVNGADHYINDLVKRGGIQYMTYTMDDDEWAAYCEANNKQLQY
ncbi:MAG: hypothetical protein IJU95_11015 [Treponema sp.]|nr:hypothetical protein [Treponema sp.]